MRHWSLRAFLGMAAAVVSAAAIAGQSPYYYSYFKEQVQLDLNTNYVSIYRDPKLGPPSEPKLAGADTNFRAGALKGWYFMDVPGGATPASIATIKKLTNGAVMPVFTDRKGLPLVFSTRLHVRFNSNVTAEEAEAILSHYPVKSFSKMLPMKGLYGVELNTQDGIKSLQIANDLAALPQVRFASPDAMLAGHKDFVPNDPLFADQWALGSTGVYPAGWGNRLHLKVNDAWNLTVGKPSILVGLFEDGVQLNHPDITIADTKEFAFGQNGGGPDGDFDNHGTLMAGIIAGRINNSIGIAGVAGGARVVSARVNAAGPLAGQFFMDPVAFYQAAVWMASVGVRITNNSNNYDTQDALIDDTYEWLKSQGIVSFVAAGNTGGASLEYPSDLETVNSVTGVLPNGTLAPGSSTGDGIQFSAPGAFNTTTDRTGADGFVLQNYVQFDSTAASTSFACAYASGIAALMLSVNPNMSPDQIHDIMAITALDLIEPPMVTPDRVGYDNRWGYGLLNAAGAVSASQVATVSVTPNPIIGGVQGTVTATLASPALVDLDYGATTDNHNVAVVIRPGIPPVEDSLQIAAGSASGSSMLVTKGVDAPVFINVRVDLANVRRSVKVQVLPATLKRLALSATSVYGGVPVNGQVDLNGVAGPSGTVIDITDNSNLVTAPATVKVNPQNNKVVFAIATKRTPTTQNATITATLAGVSMSKTLQLKPVLTDIQTFAISPNSIMGGGKPIGTVTMTNPAPTGGAVISLADVNPATSFFPSITIPQGQKVGTFTIYTSPVGVTTYATVSATYLGVAKSADLTITPTLWVTKLTVTPSVVRGGFPSVGRIEIYSGAPTGGVPVSVTDTNSYVSTPLKVWVPAGKTWVEFPITTYRTLNTVTGDVRASYGGRTEIAPITVYK